MPRSQKSKKSKCQKESLSQNIKNSSPKDKIACKSKAQKVKGKESNHQNVKRTKVNRSGEMSKCSKDKCKTSKKL